MIEASFYIDEKGRGHQSGPLVGIDMVCKRCNCVLGAEGGERTALISVEEPKLVGHRTKSESKNPLQYFRKCLEEDYNPKGCWVCIRCLFRLVKNNSVCLFEA